MYADNTFSLELGDDLQDLASFVNLEINKMAGLVRSKQTKDMIFIFKSKKSTLNQL
jgi:hypothetical protein